MKSWIAALVLLSAAAAAMAHAPHWADKTQVDTDNGRV